MFKIDMFLFQNISGVCLWSPQTVPADLVCFAIFCAKYLPLFVLIHIVFLALKYRLRYVKILFNMFCSFAVACAISYLIGKLCYKPRPFVINHDWLLLKHKDNASFPSNHAMIYSVYLYFIYYYRRIIRYNFIVISTLIGLLICWARLFLGIHFPLDIVGGVLIGLLCSFMIDKMLNQFFWSRK